MNPVVAFIGLGSNLADPVFQVLRACRSLDALPGCRVVARAHLYRSGPLDHSDQPDYINTVAAVRTTLQPRTLLEALLAIERDQGRQRGRLNGPRTLDLDLLIYGERIESSPELTVPHPRMAGRTFVLYPLSELVGRDFVIPGQGPLRELLGQCQAPFATPLAAQEIPHPSWLLETA